MSATKLMLPFVGRKAIIDGLMSRLQHPDDLRDNPTKFISPGFHAIAGAGKSRLLHEVELRGKLITPYVVKIDFEPRSANVTPRTPLAFLRHLIDVLEEQDLNSRPAWRRIFWRWSNPFKQCRQIVQQYNVTTINQNLTVTSSQARDIAQTIDLGTTIPESLSQAFTIAIVKLYAKQQIKRLFGDIGIEKRVPLVLVILDTVELAPRPMREWLDQLYSIIGAKNKLSFHFMFVVAGRFQLTGVIETPLPPFDLEEAKEFVKAYASFLLDHPTGKQQRIKGLEQLIDSEEAQEKLASCGQGIPLVLQLLVNTVALDPKAEIQVDNLPAEHDVLVRFVIENYLDRLKEQAGRQNDDQLWLYYYLLLYSAIPRRIPSPAFLRALLQGLTGTLFDARSNYDELFQDLSHESFVERAGGQELIVHSMIREGMCSYLRSTDAERFSELHQRAESWFHANHDLPNYFYHRLYCDSPEAFDEFKTAISSALSERRWRDVQAMIEVSTSVPLDAPRSAWIEIYKAQLAWGENNQNLALERLRKLYQLDIPALRGEVASQLELWLGFSTKLETRLSTGEAVEVPEQYVNDLLIWAEIRNQVWTKAYALLRLGESEFKLRNYENARELIEHCLENANRAHDNKTTAFAMRRLGEIALNIGPLTDASRWLRPSCNLYASLGEQQKQASTQVLLAVALFTEGELEEVKLLMEQSLKIQEATNDLAQQAQTLRVSWLMAKLNPEMGVSSGPGEMLDRFREYSSDANDALGIAQALSLKAETLIYERSHDNEDKWDQVMRRMQTEAAKNYHEAGDRLGEAHSYCMLGLIEALHNSDPQHFDLALINFKQARSLFRAEHDMLSRANTQIAVGAISYIVGQRNPKILGEFREALDEAFEIYQELGDKSGEAAISFIKGQIALLRLEYENAAQYLEEARTSFASNYDSDSASLVLTIESLLERVAQKSGPPDKHIEHLVFPMRIRVLDLYGWSSILRRETGAGLTIRQVEQPQFRQTRGGHTLVYTFNKDDTARDWSWVDSVLADQTDDVTIDSPYVPPVSPSDSDNR